MGLLSMIRGAEQADYKTIKSLLKQGASEGMLQPRKKREIKKAIKKGRTVVAIEEREIVGTASVNVYDRRIAEVRSLYVVPGKRGNGIATDLINGILEKPVSILPSGTLFAITQTPQIFEKTGFSQEEEGKHIVFKQI